MSVFKKRLLNWLTPLYSSLYKNAGDCPVKWKQSGADKVIFSIGLSDYSKLLKRNELSYMPELEFWQRINTK